MDLTKLKAVFFDFDGLLVDTEPLHYKAYTIALESLSCPLDFDFPFYLGLAHHESGTALRDYILNKYPNFPTSWTELRNEKIKIYSSLLHKEPLELLSGVAEMISILEAKNIPMCIVTNSPREDILAICRKKEALQKIKILITREDYKNPKPSPDAYLKALELFPESSTENFIGFEDSLKGIAALQKAKIPPILICPSNHPQLIDIKGIHHYSSMLEFIAQCTY